MPPTGLAITLSTGAVHPRRHIVSCRVTAQIEKLDRENSIGWRNHNRMTELPSDRALPVTVKGISFASSFAEGESVRTYLSSGRLTAAETK